MQNQRRAIGTRRCNHSTILLASGQVASSADGPEAITSGPGPPELRACPTRLCGRQCADQLDALIEAEGPDTVAAFIAEPVMQGDGALSAQRAGGGTGEPSSCTFFVQKIKRDMTIG